MMNRVEIKEEMMALVNGGKDYKVGDHVEVKITFLNTLFGATYGGTVIGVGTSVETGKKVYNIRFNGSHFGNMYPDGWYEASDLE